MINTVFAYHGTGHLTIRNSKNIFEKNNILKNDYIKLNDFTSVMEVYEPFVNTSYNIDDYLPIFSEFDMKTDIHASDSSMEWKRYSFVIPLDRIESVIQAVRDFKNWPLDKTIPFNMFITQEFDVLNGFTIEETRSAINYFHLSPSKIIYIINKKSCISLFFNGPINNNDDISKYSLLIANILKKPLEKIKYDLLKHKVRIN
jgi:hypothetical protein